MTSDFFSSEKIRFDIYVNCLLGQRINMKCLAFIPQKSGKGRKNGLSPATTLLGILGLRRF